MNPSDFLDITQFKEQPKDELVLAIASAVENTQAKSIVLPLPNILIMRPDQFELLNDDPNMSGMYMSEENIWRTPLNVLEIRVKA